MGKVLYMRGVSSHRKFKKNHQYQKNLLFGCRKRQEESSTTVFFTIFRYFSAYLIISMRGRRHKSFKSISRLSLFHKPFQARTFLSKWTDEINISLPYKLRYMALLILSIPFCEIYIKVKSFVLYFWKNKKDRKWTILDCFRSCRSMASFFL